eukprot:scaffold1699_cov114-Isochrysis_galbana.AAC.8
MGRTAHGYTGIDSLALLDPIYGPIQTHVTHGLADAMQFLYRTSSVQLRRCRGCRLPPRPTSRFQHTESGITESLKQLNVARALSSGLMSDVAKPAHGCRSCGKWLHSSILCSSVWMPMEGAYSQWQKKGGHHPPPAFRVGISDSNESGALT